MKKILTAMVLALVLCLAIGIAVADQYGVVTNSAELVAFAKDPNGKYLEKIPVTYKDKTVYYFYADADELATLEKKPCGTVVPVTYTGTHPVEGTTIVITIDCKYDHDKSFENTLAGSWTAYPQWNQVVNGIAVAPTCGSTGSTSNLWQCSKCGAQRTSNAVVVTKANHEFHLAFRTIPHCDDTLDGVAGKLDAQCVYCGGWFTDIYPNYTQYDYKKLFPELQTEMLGMWTVREVLNSVALADKVNNYNTWEVWANLNEPDSATYNGHDFGAYGNWIVYKAADCVTKQRIERRFCKRCGEWIQRTVDVETVGPEYVVSAEKVIDCFTIELTYECKLCGHLKTCVHGPIKVYLEAGKTIAEVAKNKDVIANGQIDLINKGKKVGDQGYLNINVIQKSTSHSYIENDKYLMKRWSNYLDVNGDGITEASCQYPSYKAYICVSEVSNVYYYSLSFDEDGEPTYTYYGPATKHPVKFVKVADAPGHEMGDWVEIYAPGTDGTPYGYYKRNCVKCNYSEMIASIGKPTADGKPAQVAATTVVAAPTKVNTWELDAVLNAWVYYGADGTIATSTWVGDYYVKADGTMATSTYIKGSGCYWWVGADGKCDGAKYAWHGSDAEGWWFGSSNWYAANTTIKLDGVSYSFDAAGYLK